MGDVSIGPAVQQWVHSEHYGFAWLFCPLTYWKYAITCSVSRIVTIQLIGMLIGIIVQMYRHTACCVRLHCVGFTQPLDVVYTSLCVCPSHVRGAAGVLGFRQPLYVVDTSLCVCPWCCRCTGLYTAVVCTFLCSCPSPWRGGTDVLWGCILSALHCCCVHLSVFLSFPLAWCCRCSGLLSGAGRQRVLLGQGRCGGAQPLQLQPGGDPERQPVAHWVLCTMVSTSMCNLIVWPSSQSYH